MPDPLPPKRCAHPNLTLTEEATAFTAHFWENGRIIGHETDYGDYTGRVHVACRDCGLDRWYSTYKARPAWVWRRCEAVMGE